MRSIVVLILALAFVIVSVFLLNWFWRILAIPTVFIAAYDFIQVQKDKRRVKK